MPNALTGDFEAVLEVSGGTLDRLVASMHQNAFVNAAKPSLPHVAYFRIGDDQVDGVRGSVAAQIGAPHVVLIHGATDRFRLEIGLRARFRADPGSTPLADIIHGTVRAEYRLRDIDPNCWGWQGIASDYLWMRVVEDSVSFDGTVLNESSILTPIDLIEEQLVKAHIVKHLVALLKTQFEPTPQPIGKGFRRMRSLAFGNAPGQSGIAIPHGLSSETPAGNLASISDLFLGGRDFGLAVSSDYIISAIQPMLDPIEGLQRDFHVHGDAGVGGGLEIDYHARIDSATVEWLGPMPAPFFSQSSGLIRIALSGSGWATRLYRSGVYNIGSVSLDDLRMSFAADQFLVLSFEQAAERLSVTLLGAPSVSVNYGGPFAGEVKALARNEIATQIQANVAGAVSQAQSQLNGLTAPARKSALIDQLRRIDEAAGARFDEAVFRQDGVILRGTISLTPRYAPHVSFEKTAAGDGFDAIESWIPGGRVDTFEWTWRWFTNPVEAPPGPPGSSSEEHSFLLRRPQGPRSKFGLMLSLDNPLPGLDGSGRVCLAVRGVHVDHVTGAPVPIESVMECAQFGYEFKMPYEVGPYVRICDPLRAIAERPAPEIGILRVGVSEAPEAASNTLVLYLDRTWSEEAASTLRAGLESCRRENAGLLVLVLFRDGVLNAGDPELQARLQELSTSLAAPMLVNEDVRGGWSKVLALPTGRGELAWRLITPAGVVSWVHHGRADAELLASVLDERLVASRQASLVRVRPDISIGGRVPIDLVVRPCPPVPLSRPGTAGSKLVFVQKGHSSSLTQLERLGREYPRRGEDKPFVAIVVDGADAEEAEALRRELNLDFPAFPDPDGTLTRRAGIPFAPTIITLDEDGRVTGCEMGVAFSGDGDGDLEHGE